MAATLWPREAPRRGLLDEGLAFDPANPAFHEDPYPLYARLREEAAVHRGGASDPAWVVTRYADCLSLLRDPRVGAVPGFALHPAVRGARGRGLERRAARDACRRQVLARAITPWTLQRLRPRIEGLVDRLVAALLDREEADLLLHLVEPAAVSAVCELLDVPTGDRARYREWLPAMADGIGSRGEDPTISQAARHACASHVAARAEEDDRSPAGGLLTRLASATREPPLSAGDRVGLAVQLAREGYVMSRGLVANTLLALLRQRDAAIAVQADPGLASFVVEECLRWDPPLQLAVRVSLCDIELHGQRIEAGECLWLLLAAANRDPRSFKEPDRFDPTRASPPCLGSGNGGPFAVGHHLGRMAAEMVVRGLARHGTRMVLASEQLDRPPSALFRLPGRLPVALARA